MEGGAQPPVTFVFGIRPEDLRHTEPSRITAQQTLGGANVDAFGAGLSTISMSGHNGWRGGLLLSGEDLFAALRDTVFQSWHERRQAQIAAGNDPNAIELTLIDTLDDITAVVVPMSFALMRSKASPLLMRYSLELTKIADAGDGGDEGDSILDALSDPLRWVASVTGLGSVVASLQSALFYVQGVYGLAQAYVGAFLTMATDVIAGVATLASLGTAGGVLYGNLSAALAAGLAMSLAGMNLFRMLASDVTLTSQASNQMTTVAATFLEASCLIGNGLAVGVTYTSLDGMLGASSCSSTGGGDPPSPYTLAGTSPFSDLFSTPTSTPAISVSATAQAALGTLQGDVLLLTPAIAQAAAQAVTAGVVLGGDLLPSGSGA